MATDNALQQMAERNARLPFIQLTTLDENKDVKQVSLNKNKDNEQSDK
jgi:hypothetical protein